MALSAGTKLGPYEIQSPLGAGGMGEVYRARDSRLDRAVAIKILPAHLSENPDARQRFDREARAISSLSHPNICHLYDVGQQDGISYLVMEFLEGETLADRLRKGPLPLDQVFKIGAEICEGLEKAHRSGVVHRDLKPSNIMLTKSGAKLMDFGLAKAPAAAAPAGSSSNSLATRSQPLTAEGTIVGTFQYMSPEQVEGKEADARSDIFSLGTVLYEMVTGKRAFEGKTTASTIAAILAVEPKAISAVQPMSPAGLEHVVQSCLAKDPEERLQTAHDVKVELRWIAATSSHTGSSPRLTTGRTHRERLAWLLVGLLLLAVIGGGVAWWIRARAIPRAMFFNSPVPFAANDIAVSPDGQTVALVAYSEQANKYAIWRYEVGGRTAVVVPGTEDAAHPFWSPDSRSIGFFSQGKLRKVDIFSGRSPQVLCDAPNGRGGAWNRDGVILFAPNIFGGIYRLSSGGGTPIEISKPDESRSESSHRWPVFLPDQRHFLYMAANFAGEFDNNAIFVGSLDSSEKRLVVGASSNAAYADPGYLLYWRDGSLVAQPFDTRSYTVKGEPRTISDEVQYFPQIDLAPFGVANNGTLVVQNGRGADKSQLTWFDRSGKQVGAVGPPGLMANPAISPDGRRLAFERTERDGRHVDIWIRELANDAMTRLTFGPGLNELPIWSNDGKRVVYSSSRRISWRLTGKNADGSGPEQQIGELLVWGAFWDWSHDAKYLLVLKSGELLYLSVPDGELKQFLPGKWAVRNAQFSPDGKWVAYSSYETGNWEIYVSSFPRADSKWQISTGGGEEPRWRRDGKELFYMSAERKMMAVPVKTGATFEAGSPVTLFQTHLRQSISALDLVNYDVSADGQRFLINTKVDEPNAAPLSVILNWASEMEK
jgi:serine/threonine protein kinase/Tol biopolymer transport system component